MWSTGTATGRSQSLPFGHHAVFLHFSAYTFTCQLLYTLLNASTWPYNYSIAPYILVALTLLMQVMIYCIINIHCCNRIVIALDFCKLAGSWVGVSWQIEEIDNSFLSEGVKTSPTHTHTHTLSDEQINRKLVSTAYSYRYIGVHSSTCVTVQTLCQSVSLSVRPSVRQSIRQSVRPSASQPAGQPAGRPAGRPVSPIWGREEWVDSWFCSSCCLVQVGSSF